ncbi:MAG TPA: hypothetical protein PLL50_07560 [Propionicimonas sp.]|nr:hypothetical protein [Propionicimonas sp.]HQA78198.1 hypothetical protein [Propionicimonas sp.]
MPLIRPAKLNGISSCRGDVPIRLATASTTGTKIATTPVELITEPSAATQSISRITSRAPESPAWLASQSPSR